jgi:hypothetical protein
VEEDKGSSRSVSTKRLPQCVCFILSISKTDPPVQWLCRCLLLSSTTLPAHIKDHYCSWCSIHNRSWWLYNWDPVISRSTRGSVLDQLLGTVTVSSWLTCDCIEWMRMSQVWPLRNGTRQRILIIEYFPVSGGNHRQLFSVGLRAPVFDLMGARRYVTVLSVDNDNEFRSTCEWIWVSHFGSTT